MERGNKGCVYCMELQISLNEKEKEIRKLKMHVKKLTNILLISLTNSHTNSNTNFDDSFEENDIDNHNISCSDLIDLSCDILCIKSDNLFESKSVQTEVIETKNDLQSTYTEIPQLVGLPKVQGRPLSRRKAAKMKCFRCKKLGHMARNCKAPDPSVDNAAMIASACISQPSTVEFVANSAATHHFSQNQELNSSATTAEGSAQSSLPSDENVEDYVYDPNYQMYYNSSTGYYYDAKSGLMYDPQSSSYYKYNYDTYLYELVSYDESRETQNTNKMNSFVHEVVLDQVNNLNLNDESIQMEKYEIKTCEDGDFITPENSTKENQSADTTVLEKNNEADVPIGSDWQPTEGSKMTVKDMVKQVVDEQNNMSDYIYDETRKMYYSPSTGYFYDAVKKLLYDPSSGNYYFYDDSKQTYEFYCQVDPISSDKEKTSEKQESPEKQDSSNSDRLKYRKKYWKKKLEFCDDSCSTVKSDENTNGQNSEEEFSAPEDGEVFSSDDESSPPVCIIRSPVKGSDENNKKTDICPPSIRAIVEDSENLQIGSLILITCSGGIIGRDKTNAVYLPDVCVSKAHAEIRYDVELQTYSIEDLGSQNGTFINEKRLSKPKVKSEPNELKHGDKLALGSCKLLLHIHEGYETCDSCEPGQVLAEISSNTTQPITLMTKEEKEKQRREELRRIKKKYGLQGADLVRRNIVISIGCEDKAEIRRQTVGSDNPYEKTEEASDDVTMPETNKGYQMLKKMGWKEGQTLGTTAESGLLEPIPLRPWTSKAGLGSASLGINIADYPEDKRVKRWVKAQDRYFQLSLGSNTS